MNPLQSIVPSAPRARPSHAGARHLYLALLGEHGSAPGTIDDVTRSASWSFLRGCLDDVAQRRDDVPADPRALPAWLEQAHERTASSYRQYVDERRAGAPRRFFRNRSHALAFLRTVAPTKLVDGAWLYGLLQRAKDARLAPLIRTYLEELGDGVASQNHVLVYRALLAHNGCDAGQRPIDDAHYVQGAIQLALAHHADRLLPEVIGFNLGYEQLPLHLPITAYELNELDVDPYYFTLHVTIDNASSGHASKALQTALACLPTIGDADAFYRRVLNGYRLNDLGLGTTAAIEAFDLERELVAALVEKARVGANLHGDYCRIGGRTVADWLSAPGDLPAMLSTLASTGWIRRGAPPEESRFWRVLHDPRGPMFGVFDDYTSQLLRDWIVDAPDATSSAPDARGPRSPNRFSKGAVARGPSSTRASTPSSGVAQVIARHLDDVNDLDRDDDVAALEDRLAGVDDRDAALSALRGFLSPRNHATPAGLLATRIYSDVFGR